MKIIIGICTYKRPEMLKVALLSINDIETPKIDDLQLELMILDNDYAESARDVVLEFKRVSRFPVYYRVERKQGLSSARNKLLDECSKIENTAFIAFCDDDDVVDKVWLCELLETQKQYCAVAVGGPWISCKGIIQGNYQTGEKIIYINTGNALFDLNFINRYKIRFEEALNHQGCEDTDFSLKIKAHTDLLFWTNKAIVYEQFNEVKQSRYYRIKRLIAFSVNRRMIELQGMPQNRMILFFQYLALIFYNLIRLLLFFCFKKGCKFYLKEFMKKVVMLFVICGVRSNFYKY